MSYCNALESLQCLPHTSHVQRTPFTASGLPTGDEALKGPEVCQCLLNSYSRTSVVGEQRIVPGVLSWHKADVSPVQEVEHRPRLPTREDAFLSGSSRVTSLLLFWKYVHMVAVEVDEESSKVAVPSLRNLGL